MSDERRFRISMNMKIVIALGVVSGLLLYFWNDRWAPESILSKCSVLAVFSLWFAYFVWRWGFLLIRNQSPKFVTEDDVYTWKPAVGEGFSGFRLPAPKVNGRSIDMDFQVIVLNGFDAMGVSSIGPIAGPGKDGYYLIPDAPGFSFRSGDSLVANTVDAKCFIGERGDGSHEELGWIADKLRGWCIKNGYHFTDDTPVYMSRVPNEQPVIPDGLVNAIIDLDAVHTYYGKELRRLRDVALDWQMDIEKKRASDHGTIVPRPLTLKQVEEKRAAEDVTQ